MDKGKLFIIPTPIGNLEDITIRGKRMLKELTHLACEDTRSTKKLLNLLDIAYHDKRFYAYHEHNEVISAEGIVKILLSGEDVGLVSDAGTPLISDPGYSLLHLCRTLNIYIVSLPGASSVVAALAASGLATDKFSFLGFIPQKKGRQTFIQNLVSSDTTTIFFESTHRIKKLLTQLDEFEMTNRSISISKEISKLNERHIRVTVGEAKQMFETEKNIEKGEFVVIIGKK